MNSLKNMNHSVAHVKALTLKEKADKQDAETSLGIAIFWAWVHLCTKISGKLFACMTDKNQFFGRGQIERDKERLVSGTHLKLQHPL